MKTIVAWASVAALASAPYAQTINVRGKVSGSGGQALGMAVVELVKRGLKDTTGTDGMFSLSGSVALRRAPATEGMSLEGGVLRIALAHSAPVTVEVFDVRGNQLRMES